MSLRTATAFSLASQLAILASSFLSGVVIARTLGPSGKGTYSLVVLTSGFVVLIGNLGVPVFVASTIGKQKHSVEVLLRNSFFLFACSTFLVTCVFLVFRAWLGQNAPLAPFLGLLTVIIPLGLLREHLAAFLQGLNKIGRFAFTRAIGPLITMSLLLIFVLNHPSIWTALYCWLGGEAISLAVTLALVRPFAAPGISFLPSLFKESLRFGGAVCMGNFIGVASLRLDVFLVAYFLGASAVGLYSVAVAISSVIMYLPSAMAVALLPRFSSATAEESYELAARTCRMAMLWGLGCAVVLSAVGGVLIRAAYGNAFSPSVNAMIVLLPGTILYGLAHITTVYFNAFARRPAINTALAAVSLAIGIGLDLVLIPTFGIVGASIASSVAYLLSMMVTLTIFAKVSGRTPLSLLAVGKNDFSELARFVSRNMRALVE
ncbi:MAG: flippase [Candidatus Eisenbacteria bacterium]|nr:flippase [Candidatus Eisenbacteria bacterium]